MLLQILLAVPAPTQRARYVLIAAFAWWLSGCGREAHPARVAPVDGAPSNSAAPSPSVTASSPAQAIASNDVATCWRVEPGGDADGLQVGRAFAHYAARSFARLDHPEPGTADAILSSELRKLGIGELGPVCPALRVSLQRSEDGRVRSARFDVDLTVQKPSTHLTVDAQLPPLRDGRVPFVEQWTFVEPVERALVRALVSQSLATTLEASPQVSDSAALKLSRGFFWGWSRGDNRLSQCVFSSDLAKHWCWRSPSQQRAPLVVVEGWTEVRGEVHGFLHPTDGVFWAVSLPSGQYAVTRSTSAWPTSGFVPLPNDDDSPGTALLPLQHERRSDGAVFQTEVGAVVCHRTSDRFSCSVP